MGRNSYCMKQKLRKGLWSPEEDEKLYSYITRFGVGCWSSVPKLAGLQRCGKSCRLRWINYLRPDLKRGMFSQEEEDLIISLHEALGNRWAQIAAQLPGRTDNEIKNFWNSSLKKKLIKQGIDPNTHKMISEIEAQHKDNLKGCPYSSPHLHPKGFPNLATPSQIEQESYILGGKQIYDPLYLPDFQSNVGHHDYYPSNFLHASKQSSYENRQLEGIFVNDGLSSIADLANFDHNNVMREGSSSNGARMDMNVVENASIFSWGRENKLDSIFRFQLSGVEIEEKKPSLWDEGTRRFDEENSEGAFGNYPLAPLSHQELAGANLEGYNHLI